MQVGASNELPESEELDALYDRFLIRRQVAQVCIIPCFSSFDAHRVSVSSDATLRECRIFLFSPRDVE